MNWLDFVISANHSVTLAKRFGSERRFSMLPLRYRSRRILPGRTGAAVNLTPRALGWRTIHFAVRHLAVGAVWSGPSVSRGRVYVGTGNTQFLPPRKDTDVLLSFGLPGEDEVSRLGPGKE